MKLGQAVRGLLPAKLKNKVPAAQDAGVWPTRTHARKVLMLAGCVQPAMQPNINSATARVLDAAGIEVVLATKAGCCGAVKFHLNDHDGGKAEMRRNIDAWWPHIEAADGRDTESTVSRAPSNVSAVRPDDPRAASVARLPPTAGCSGREASETDGIPAAM